MDVSFTFPAEPTPIHNFPSSPPGPADVVTPQAGNAALDELRTFLRNYDLDSLAEIAYQYQLLGYTPDQILIELESTAAFQERFAGSRDPNTNQLLLTPGQYIQYERDLSSVFSSYGLTLDRATIASLVSSGRSVSEVNDDLKFYAQIRRNGTLRSDFYAYTGIDPGDDGMFALALGLAPNLTSAYNQAIASGVTAQEYIQRKFEFQNNLRVTQGKIDEANTIMNQLSTTSSTQQAVLQEAKTKESAAATTYNGAKANYDKASKMVAKIRAEITDLAARAHNAPPSTRDSLNAQIDALQAKLRTWRTSQDTWAKRTLSARTAYDAAVAARSAAESGLATTTNQMTNQRDTLSSLGTTLNQQTAALNDLINNPVDLTPDYIAQDPERTTEELRRAAAQALGTEQARFRAGGTAAGVSDSPYGKTF